MAQNKKQSNDDGELGGYAPAAPGIHNPFLVTEGGHEGARAVSEYRAHAEGRITDANAPGEKFRDYDDRFQVI